MAGKGGGGDVGGGGGGGGGDSSGRSWGGKQRRPDGAASAAATAADAEGRELSREDELASWNASLELAERGLLELAEKTRINEGTLEASRAKQAEWLAKVHEASAGFEAAVPVFPIGDSLLEPFWPQGLGSNRGFHSGLDAVWASHLLASEGLDAALLERNFWFDLMLAGPWNSSLLKPAKSWSADPATRYADGPILRHKGVYTNIFSKRLYRGAAAVPPRVDALALKGGGAYPGGVGRG